VKPTTNFSQTPATVPKDVLIHDHSGPEFLKGISHEMRTPLNVIIGICQLLERDRRTPLSPMHRDAVDRMERNARTLMHAINRLIETLRKNNNGHLIEAPRNNNNGSPGRGL
jgi:signal transduction histidine kinase